MIKISGVVEQALGKFYCIRGYAPIKDLEKLSIKSDSFQRDLLNGHKGEMLSFLTAREGTFFPEVILSANLANTEHSYDPNKPELEGYADEISTLTNAISSKTELKKCNLGAITIDLNFAKGTQNQNSRTVNNESNKVLIGNISINEKKFVNKFIRIDGNHRLSASRELSDEFNYYAPFCLILFTNHNSQERLSTLLFHNINYKQIPIDREHNLRIIINNLYSDEELSDQFGINFLYTRYIFRDEIIKIDHYHEINKLIEDNAYTYFVDLFDYLIKSELIEQNLSETDIVNLMKKNLSKINSALSLCKISAKKNISVLGALSFYCMQSEEKYSSFLKWIDKNDITSIEKLTMNNVIQIFDKIYKNIPKKVFLARWYPAEGDDQFTRAKNRLKAISKIVKEDFKLELIDIGTQEGGTFAIREKMYDQITASDIFIADLTGARHNVMVEVGYALKNIGRKRMLFYYEPTSESAVPPFDLNGFRCEKIKEAADLDDAIPKHISAILECAEIGQI